MVSNSLYIPQYIYIYIYIYKYIYIYIPYTICTYLLYNHTTININKHIC